MRFIFVLTIIFVPQLLWASNLMIKTLQEASEVFVKSLEGSEFKKIGEAPGDFELEQVIKKANNSEVFILEVRKSGYKTYRIIIPKLQKSDLALTIDLEKIDGLEEAKKIDKIVNQMFEAQRMIRGRNYSGANKVIEAIEKDNSNLSVTKELLGSTAYLEKDYKKALDLYTKAYSTNPENLDALKMVKFLEKSMGITKAGDGN